MTVNARHFSLWRGVMPGCVTRLLPVRFLFNPEGTC